MTILRAEGATTLGVAIQLGNDDRTDVDFLFESPSLSFTSLTNGGVHNEDNIIRFLEIHIYFNLKFDCNY